MAVKYTRCDTSDAASLERCIREAVLSRRMSHPHVVQTFAWTVLTADDATVRALCLAWCATDQHRDHPRTPMRCASLVMGSSWQESHVRGGDCRHAVGRLPQPALPQHDAAVTHTNALAANQCAIKSSPV